MSREKVSGEYAGLKHLIYVENTVQDAICFAYSPERRRLNVPLLHQIVDLFLQGENRREIASTLGVSEEIVINYLNPDRKRRRREVSASHYYQNYHGTEGFADAEKERHKRYRQEKIAGDPGFLERERERMRKYYGKHRRHKKRYNKQYRECRPVEVSYAETRNVLDLWSSQEILERKPISIITARKRGFEGTAEDLYCQMIGWVEIGLIGIHRKTGRLKDFPFTYQPNPDSSYRSVMGTLWSDVYEKDVNDTLELDLLMMESS